MVIETVGVHGHVQPWPRACAVQQTRGSCWVLPALVAVPISALLGLCCSYPAKRAKASWAGVTHFIAVQVCGKLREFHQCESGIHHTSSSVCCSRAGSSSWSGHRRGDLSWRCWLEAPPGGLQPESAALLLILDQLSSGFAHSRPADLQGWLFPLPTATLLPCQLQGGAGRD